MSSADVAHGAAVPALGFAQQALGALDCLRVVVNVAPSRVAISS